MSLSKIIFGNGFIAKNIYRIKNDIYKSNYVIYAAGISNSKIKLNKSFQKEITILKKFLKKNYNKKILYISTASITDSSRNKSQYVKNKILIEGIIKKKIKRYIILRLPEIAGISKNKNTLINFLYNKVKFNKKFQLFINVKRNILDIDDVNKMLKKILMNKKIKNKTITLSNRYSISPIRIVKIIEKKLRKKANYNIYKSNFQKWNLNYKKNKKYFIKANIKFNQNYLTNVINKYY